MPNIKRKILLIAPHPDDIAYSSLLPASDKENMATVMTIFGRSRYAYGNSTNDEKKISSIRKSEDIKFSRFINAKLLYFNYPDSSITFSSEKNYEDLYPFHNELSNIIKSNIVNSHYDSVYFPMAIGWHYDHRIIREILMKEVIPHCNRTIEFIMYEDLPYALPFSDKEIQIEINSIIRKYGYLQTSHNTMSSPDVKILKDSIEIYESQYNADTISKIVNHKIKGENIIENFHKIHV